MQSLNQIDDKNLVAHLEILAGSERANQVEILRHLAELDERRIVVEMGYSGMWDFCRRRLKFSEATSTRRLHVARAAKKFPDLLAMLADGRLNLGTASDLSQVLTEANAAGLLATAAGKTSREVQRLVESDNAKPAAKRDVIRRVASTPMVAQLTPLNLVELANAATVAPGLVSYRPVGPDTPAALGVPIASSALVAPGTPVATSKVSAAVAAPTGQPTPVLHRVSFTADEQVVAKLERLQEILGGATLAEVCDRAADLLLDKVDRSRRVKRREQKAASKRAMIKKPARGQTSKSEARNPEPRKPEARIPEARIPEARIPEARIPEARKPEPCKPEPCKPEPRKPETRRPGVALADQVIVDAGMQCAFVSKHGVRCTETRYLSIDHVRPYALGGKSNDIRNLRCYCMAHNLLAGRQTFGSFHVQSERQSEK